MCRFWDVSLLMFFSVSLVLVGADPGSELPPPKNLNFVWETPFRLSLRWEKPEDLSTQCTVNYTVYVHPFQNCSGKEPIEARRVAHPSCKLNISNENGLCISVSTIPENCKNRGHSQSANIVIPPPPVKLVTDLRYEYSHNRMKCTWSATADVQDLDFYYWLPRSESIIKCVPDETMKAGECIIHNEFLKDTLYMFYLFNGTHNGVPVNNTFKREPPTKYVKLKKPQLKIHRDGHNLIFQTNMSEEKEFADGCYSYNYMYSACNKNFSVPDHKVQYDPACKYSVRVQVIFSEKCGAGKSDPSDEEVYGEDSYPNLPGLLAVIIIPLIVSCCLLTSLVLLRRNKDIIFPKIPEPTLFFKDMLINNIKTTEDPRQRDASTRLYVPTEEIVESRISLEPDTPFVRTTNNVPHKQT